jgi:hypothetical protein
MLMNYLPSAALLLCACLPAHRASCQVRPPVVQLDSGLTLRRPLIGLDPAYYQRLRQAYAADTQLLALRGRRITILERGQQLTDTALAYRTQALRASQAALATSEADFARLRLQTQTALAHSSARPALLDGHTYLGAAVGAAVGMVLGLLLH